MNNKLSALEAIVNRTNAANSATAFFPLLLKFAKLILQDPELQPSLKKIKKEGKKAVGIVHSAEKVALNELKTHERTVRKYLSDNNVKNEFVVQALDTFQDHLKKNYKLNLLLVPIEQALYVLLNDDSFDHSAFIKTFGGINQIGYDKFIHRTDAFPKFEEWDKKLLYLTQEQPSSVWYSLNQILIFSERYDFKEYDNMVEKLIKTGVDTTKLQEEHLALIQYAYFDKPTPLFPTIEEYKHYVLNLMEFLATRTFLPIHHFAYDPLTGELQIDDDKPINYQTHKNPAKLLKQVHDKNKPLSFLDVHIVLGLSEKHHKVTSLGPIEVKEIDSFIRLVNDPIKRTGKPPFFVTQIRKDSRKEREIFVSSCYKPF
ncbi:MAG: hypothetical protein NTZ68_03875 [Candidatus Dependentiae bacterium]|nr:hypothetical protein [Candidatus Dependentiae bacterium]